MILRSPHWVALLLAACAANPEHAAQPEPPAAEPEPKPSVAEPAVEPAASEPARAVDAAVPPLSTPNARPAPGAADGGAAPEEPDRVSHVDPGQLALRRGGEAAQSCYAQAKLPRGTSGKLLVRVALAADGKVERAEVDKARSTAKLLGGKLESCVIAAFEKEQFPAPRGGAEVVLEVPLDFKPTQ